MAGEKTEKATGRRRREERKKGNIFKSTEIVTVFSLVVSFFALKLLGPYILRFLGDMIKQYVAKAATATALTDNEVRIIFIDSCRVFAMTALPLLLITGMVAIVATMAQTKMLVAPAAMSFKFSRLSPLQGFKRLFSLRSLIELFKASIKISILLYIVYNKFVEYLPQFRSLIDMEVEQALIVLGDFLQSLIINCGVIFIFLAAADYVYQWWEYEKNLRMSKDEIKEEYKNTEGDPQIKGKIKERQRRMAMSRMMQSVPQADVVIRNPTHYAVAIKYDADKNRAPIVLAKGADIVARRIVDIAEQNNIMTIENKPLARGLFDAVEVGFEIPEEFYQPVAEVLAFVYSLTNKKP